MLDSSGDQPARVEQLERLVTPGSDPGVAIVLIPRVPRVSFPGRVNREDGRLLALTDGAGAAGGSGPRAAAPPSRAPATAEPARARSPPTTRDGLGGPGYAMAHVPAADGGRAIYEGGRNENRALTATGASGRGGRGASARHGGNMQGLGRSHDGGSRWLLAREQFVARLTRDGAAAIGQMVIRSVAHDPGLRQLLFRGMASGVREVSSSRDESARETDGDLSVGTQAIETAAEEMEVVAERFPRLERHGIHGGNRRRGADSGRQDGRGSALFDQQYRPPHRGEDGGSPGLRYAPAGRSRNTASGTSGGEYAGDSTRRSRTRGLRTHSAAISPRPHPQAGIRVAQPGTATPRRATGGLGSAAVEATRPAAATLPTTGGPRWGQAASVGAELGTDAGACDGKPPQRRGNSARRPQAAACRHPRQPGAAGRGRRWLPRPVAPSPAAQYRGRHGDPHRHRMGGATRRLGLVPVLRA